jgi:streptomycin 6-kinase
MALSDLVQRNGLSNLVVQAHNGQQSAIYSARQADGTDVIVKESRLAVPEMHNEGDALAVWAGEGAVRLLDREPGGVLLLERCVPGTSMWQGLQEGSLRYPEALRAAGELLQSLWREPPPGVAFRRLADRSREWLQTPRVAALAACAATVRQHLVETMPRLTLLHGDFHMDNILRSGQSWIVIDPLPVVGEPAYDLAQWVGTACGRKEAYGSRGPEGEFADIAHLIEDFSAAAGVDSRRVAGWAFVKSVGSLGWDQGVAWSLL